MCKKLYPAKPRRNPIAERDLTHGDILILGQDPAGACRCIAEPAGREALAEAVGDCIAKSFSASRHRKQKSFTIAVALSVPLWAGIVWVAWRFWR